jgi:hypothetical protein
MRIKHGDVIMEHHYYPEGYISFVMDQPIHKTMKLLIVLDEDVDDNDLYTSLVYTKSLNNWLKNKKATILIHWEV